MTGEDEGSGMETTSYDSESGGRSSSGPSSSSRGRRETRRGVGSSSLPRDSISPGPGAHDGGNGVGGAGDVFARISELLQFCAQTAGGYRGAQVETTITMRHSPARGGYDTFQVRGCAAFLSCVLHEHAACYGRV